jgi:tRNA(fMet)-specific endonuclease VapC
MAMNYFLDSNIIIELLNGRNLKSLEMIKATPRSRIKIPSAVFGELLISAYKKQNVERSLENLRKFTDPFEIVPFDGDAAMAYGKIRAGLKMKGSTIGPNDMMIAATVLSRGGILVTNNTREFGRVEGLQTEDWTK